MQSICKIKSLYKSKAKSGGLRAAIESLESRTLMAFAGQVVGYLPDYEYSHFNQIDLSALTHINYFSVVASSTGTLGTTSASGYNFSQLQNVVSAAHAAGVTVSITVDPGSQFQTIANSSTATNTFIVNILAFCTKYDLDGIDLDYEPATGSLGNTQKNNWGNLLAQLHAQTAARGLTLSEAVQASQDIIPAADSGDLDWYYMMDYDLDYNSSAPYSDSLSYLTTWSTTYGIPKSKLLMGVPFFGSAGTSWSNSANDTAADILNGYGSAHGGVYPSSSSDNVTIGGTTWGFNNITTLQNKAQYLIQNGYAGMMIWELGQDHFNSSGKYDQYSLLPAIKSSMAAVTAPWLTASSKTIYTLTSTSLTVTSGTVTFTANASAANPNLSITVNSGASVIFNAPQNLGGLTINGGTVTFADSDAVTSTLTSLSITSGSLNLGNTQITLPDTKASQIAGYINQGYNAGQWNGAGIVSSAAAANLNHIGAVGYYDNGQNLTVGYTIYGDTNLDGLINADDLSLMLSGQAAHGTRWQDGNFNYGTQVNADDWMLFFEGTAFANPNPNPASSASVAISPEDVAEKNNVAALAVSRPPVTTPFAESELESDDTNSALIISSDPTSFA